MIITPGHPDFYINKLRAADIYMENTVGVAGFFSGSAIRANGEVRAQFGFNDSNPNIITNLGLNSFGSGNNVPSPGFIQLGTGSSTPIATNTTLDSYVTYIGHSPNYPTDSVSISSTSPYYCQIKRTWKSAVGGATGSWTELGVSNQSESGKLTSRALFLDNLGNPTTFPILSDEQLEVSYTLRLYIPEVDSTASVLISGTSYDTITRAAYCTTYKSTVGWYPSFRPFAGVRQDCAAYTGTIGAITSSPAGYLEAGTSTSSSYITDSFYRDGSVTWSSGRATGNIRSYIAQLAATCFQIQYDPFIPKLATEILVLNQRVSWARR